MGEELATMTPPPAVDPRLLASLIQALVHGLTMQLLADPKAFDRTSMLELCVDLLNRAVNRRPTNPRRSLSRSGSSDAPSPEGSHDD
jgi:hypothetical protein